MNLITVGMSSYNVKYQVQNDVLNHNQNIYPHNLECQKYLYFINEWTMNQKVKINHQKTKSMIFKFTNNHYITTSLELNRENLELVSESEE